MKLTTYRCDDCERTVDERDIRIIELRRYGSAHRVVELCRSCATEVESQLDRMVERDRKRALEAAREGAAAIVSAAQKEKRVNG